MALSTMMVAASGGSASAGAIEVACSIAARVGAHLEGFHAKTDPTQLVMMAAEGYNMPIAGEWIDRFIADTDAMAAKTEASFKQAAARHGLPLAAAGAVKAGKSASWRVETGYAPLLVARRARFFDLVVLGRSERVIENPYSDTIEETLVRSGRPVLLAPAKPVDAIGRRIALGWNGSAEAVHVVSLSLPLLESAEHIEVITVGGEDEDSPAPLFDYLAYHGISAKHRRAAPVKGVGPGEQLLSEAREAGADLLVMGAYGHRPWREHLFGGATRQVVGVSLLPVLLAH
jgi:nucleotide-binding universal stress UspA family protein